MTTNHTIWVVEQRGRPPEWSEPREPDTIVFIGTETQCQRFLNDKNHMTGPSMGPMTTYRMRKATIT